MIAAEDIEAFAEANEDAMKAAREFARRSDKGLPADRWYDGTQGAHMVAQGIKAQAVINEMLAGAFLALWAEKRDATRLHTKDSKYTQQRNN